MADPGNAAAASTSRKRTLQPQLRSEAKRLKAKQEETVLPSSSFSLIDSSSASTSNNKVKKNIFSNKHMTCFNWVYFH